LFGNQSGLQLTGVENQV